MPDERGWPDRPDPTEIDLAHPTPELLRWTYAHGVFPMADPRTGSMEWYCPDPRGVIPLDAFRVPRSVRKAVVARRFVIRVDSVFEDVMRACAGPRTGQTSDASWIDERIVDAYLALHREGNAHSVEAWRDGRLVGGLYGVRLGAAFFGESMFVDVPAGGTDASKVCLVYLVETLRAGGFDLLDTQFWNEHLDQFGCVEIPRQAYLARLAAAVPKPAPWPAPGTVLSTPTEPADQGPASSR